MRKRIQSKGCLFGRALFGTLALAQAASAAGGAAATTVTLAASSASVSMTRTAERVVKGAAAELSPSAARAPVTFPLHAPPPGPSMVPREARILGLRLPAFIALGLGGLGAGGAIATGVAAGSRGNDPRTCDSRCTDQGVSNHTLLVTASVLSGVAAAGVGLGVAFIIREPGRSERLRLTGGGLAVGPRPTLGFGFSAQKAVAKVGWRF